MQKRFLAFTLHDVLVIMGLCVMFLTPVVYKEVLGGELSVTRIMSSILYTLPLCFLITATRSRLAFAIVSGTFMIMSFIEAMMTLLYSNYLTSGNILAIINTTSDEGGGFIMSAFHEVPFAIPVLLGWLCAVYIHKGRTSTSKNIHFSIIFAFLSVSFLAYQLQIRWQGNITTRFYVEQNVLSRPPYNFLFQTYNAHTQLLNKKYIAEAENMRFCASKPKYQGREAYVLFVGESLRYASLSLGEYERSTTPLLESLKNVTLYSNYYSAANLTMYSVPQILTRATPEDFILNYKEKGVWKPYQECGFKTFVICAGNLLRDEKYLSHGCDSLFSLTENDDDKIAGIVDSLSLIYPKTFFIVQGKGNHGPYNNFHKDQDKYHPNPVSDNASWDDHEAMVNAYDNTVLFTDFNAYNIIRAIDKPNYQSAFILVSDHGADYDTGVSDHGGNCNPRINEYHVPLIFWCSDTWAKNHPDKKMNVEKHKDAPVNSDNVFYSVCDMADIMISTKYAKPQWSIFAKTLKPHERKLLVPDGKNYITVK